MASWSVVIVGGGLAGLSAAQELVDTAVAAGESLAGRVAVVEAGRSAGGRLATRTIDRAVLDHGAQFFTVRSDTLQARVDQWLADGAVEEWCRGFAEIDGFPRYRAAGGMLALAAHMRRRLEGAGVEIVTGRRVAAVLSDGEKWVTTYHGATREPDEAAALIATPPVPQILELLRDGAVAVPAEHRERLESFTYHRVLALLAVLDRSPGLPAPGAIQQPDDPVFSFVADNQAKGISPVPAVTFHTAHALSAELWDLSDDEVVARLTEPARTYLGGAEVTSLQLKRWRHTGPVTPWPEPCLTIADRPGPLVLAGDGFGTSRFEGAYNSGLAAARAVAGVLS